MSQSAPTPPTPVAVTAIDRTDEQLLAAFAGGERAALGELAGRHERALLGLCSGLLGGRNDLAMDVVQESWLRVIRFARNFNGSSSVKTWLYRITINQCRTLLTRRAREARRDREGDAMELRRETTSDGANGPRGAQIDRAQTQETNTPVVDNEQAASVRDAVARLDIARRTLVLLCYHAGMTHAQASEILGIPLGTLKSRLHATLNQLRQWMPEEVRT